MDPLISVVIPVYNAEKYLSKCLESLSFQTFKDVEFILINDGSIDKSVEICNSFVRKDGRFKLLSQINAGAGAARNNGLHNAVGKYLMFVDSDDWVESNYIEQLFDCIESLKVDFIVSGFAKNNNGKKINYRVVKTNNYSHYQIRNVLIKEIAGGRGSGSPYSRIFRNDIIKKNNIEFPSKIKNNEDSLFNLKYLTHCKSAFVLYDWSYNYRVGHESLSHGKIKNWFDMALDIDQEKRNILGNSIGDEMNNTLNHGLFTAMVIGILQETASGTKGEYNTIRKYIDRIFEIQDFPRSINNVYKYKEHRKPILFFSEIIKFRSRVLIKIPFYILCLVRKMLK